MVPIAQGVWLARCECGATAEFPDAEQGWAWVLAHPCPQDAAASGAAPGLTIDLTENNNCGACDR